MDGAGLARRLGGPGDPATHGEVDLERRRAVLPGPVGLAAPGRRAVTDDVGEPGRRRVEERDVGCREVGERADAVVEHDRAAELGQQARERGGDRLRPALGRRPAVHVTGGDHHRADRRGGEPGQGPVDVGGAAEEQRAGLGRRERTSEHRRREPGAQPEGGQLERVAGHAQQRTEDVVGEIGEVGLQRPEDPTPPAAVDAETRCGLDHVTAQHAGRAVLERVGDVDLGPAPAQPVLGQRERPEVGRGDAERVDGRADVVQDPRLGQLGGAGAAAELGGGLEHGDRHPLLSQGHPGREAVGSRADDDRATTSAHALNLPGSRAPPGGDPVARTTAVR